MSVSWINRAAQIFRDYVTDGESSSGNNPPSKSQIRGWGLQLEEAVDASLPITPMRNFGADGTGGADDTLALKDFAAAVNAGGPGKFELDPGAIYKVLSTAPIRAAAAVSGTPELLHFTDLDGVVIDGRGATINAGYTATDFSRAIVFDACRHSRLENTKMTWDGGLAGSNGEGVAWCLLTNGCYNVGLVDCEIDGGSIGFWTSRALGSATLRDKYPIFRRCKVSNCYYGVTFFGSGDHARLDYETDNIHRSLIVYNIQGLHATIVAKDGVADDVLVGAYGTATAAEAISNDCYVKYINKKSTICGASICTLVHNQGDSSTPDIPTTLENITFDIDFTLPVGSSAALFVNVSYLGGGGQATFVGDPGNTERNIVIKGVAHGDPFRGSALPYGVEINNAYNGFSGLSKCDVDITGLQMPTSTHSVLVAPGARVMIGPNAFANTTQPVPKSQNIWQGTLSGSVATSDQVRIVFANPSVTVTYTALAGATLSTLAAGIVALINANATLAALNILARAERAKVIIFQPAELSPQATMTPSVPTGSESWAVVTRTSGAHDVTSLGQA